MTRTRARLAAAAVSLCAIGALSLGSPAYADPTTATIDPTKDTSLTIHKYEGPVATAEGCAPTGQPVAASCLTGKTALAGAEFTIYKVMDLKTNADWEAAETYYGGTYDTAGKTPAGVVTTGTDGTVKFTGDVALYHVVETKTPEGYTGSSPFFITIPMTDPANTAWDYDLDVYPKNDKVNEPRKAVLDGNGNVATENAVKAGDVLTYQISVQAPNYGDVVGAPTATSAGKLVGPDGVLDHYDLPFYMITDTFAGGLTFDEVDQVTLNGVAMVLDTDYTVSKSGQKVTVFFTNTGLDKIAASKGGTVLVDYDVTVTTIPSTGLLENTGYVYPGPKPSEGSTPGTWSPENPPTGTPEVPTNKVVSKFGQIAIYKTAGDTDEALAGVTFEVYQADYTYDADGKTITATSCAADDLDDNTLLNTFTTTAAGVGVSDMLRLSTWYNDGVEKSDAGNNTGYLDGGQYAGKYGDQTYCLVETEAAAGYQLLAEPIEFTLSVAGTATVVNPTALKNIVNQPDNLNNNLPLTGGEGTAALSLAGLALIGGGAAYYGLASRKRRKP